MRHHTFEKWILEKDTLTRAQQEELQLHLQTCRQCAGFAAADSSVGQLLRSAPPAAPAAGFRARFERRLAAELEAKRLLQHKRQVSITLALSAGLAVVLGSGVLVSMLMLLLSSDTVIFQLFQHMFDVLQVIVLLGSAGKALLGSLSGIVDPVYGYYAAAAAAALCLTWFLSLWRIRSFQVRRE